MGFCYFQASTSISGQTGGFYSASTSWPEHAEAGKESLAFASVWIEDGGLSHLHLHSGFFYEWENTYGERN